MAIIYSYPLNDDIKPLDELVGTTEKNINGQLKTVTRNFLLQDLAEFFIVDGGIQKTIILTTEGDEGPSTLDQVTGILNIPQYAGLQNLQQVTDLGNVTSNSMRVELANNYSQINVSNIGTENTTLSTYAYLRNNGSISIKSGAVESNIKNTSVTNSGVILEFPNKVSGSYTIATTSDVIAQNLQQVTDVGATTTNPITANSFIKIGGTGTNALLDNGTTIALSSIGGNQDLQEVTDIGATTTKTITANSITTNTDSTINSVRVGRGNISDPLSENTALGYQALESVVHTTGDTGYYNTAIGHTALKSLTTGSANDAFGNDTLNLCTTGTYNTAMGSNALRNLTTGTQNLAIGTFALLNNITGERNVAVGVSALMNNTGSYNTAIGTRAGGNVSSTGEQNILIGYQAGMNISSGRLNLLIECTNGGSITTGSNNIILNPRRQSGITTGSNNTIIGGFNNSLSAGLTNNVIIATGLGVVRFQSTDTGLTTVPSQTNALIIADTTGKAIATKEYVSSVAGGATNLTTSQTSTNFTINSDTGTDAIVPLGDGTLAGATLNNYTTTEKNKLAAISGTNTGDQNLQQVTNIGATTTNGIYSTVNYADEGALNGFNTNDEGTGVFGDVSGLYGAGGVFQADSGTGMLAYSVSGKSIVTFGNGTVAIESNLGNSGNGLVINSGASSTGNPIVINKNGVDKLVVNQTGELTAQKLIKEGGFDFQFLKADGSVDNNTYLTSADLPSTLDLYATTSPDPVIAGYTALVRNIADSRYNTVAVDVPTPTITGTLASPTFCGAVISDPSILLGNPGVFNFSVIGKIRRTGGSTSSGADFFFSIYKRDLAGVEELIANSAPVVVPANGGIYVEYISIALWNNGIFLSTDRVVLKFYGVKTGGGSGATYEFLFGGSDPVRGTAAVSSAIIPNIYLRDLADVEKTPALNNEILYWNDPASLWEHSLAENLVPLATATQKGLVSTTAQTFGGAKTFTGAIGASNLSGTNTGDNATNTQYSGLATSKQDTLQNTVNIKSINGNSILGSGNLIISAAAQSPFTMLANNSDVNAIPTQQIYKDIAEQTYSLTPGWAGTAPTTIISNTYQWKQVGSLVTVRVNLIYSTAGSITQAIIPLPTDMPTPFVTSALNNASDILYYGVGMFNSLTTTVATVGRNCFLRKNAANTGFEFVIVHSSAVSSRVVTLTLQYFT